MIIIHTLLLNNDPFSSRILTMDDSECKMFIIYRGDEHLINNYPEMGLYAFYILFGNEPMNRRRKAYIGQTQNAIIRFELHISAKDFWECMCIFINSHELFIRSEIQYLEYLGIKTAIECTSFDLLENCLIPTEPRLSQLQINNIEHYFTHVVILLNYSGFYIFYKKQFDMQTFSKKNSHKIIDRIVKTYRNTNHIDNNYDDYCEEEEDITDIWLGETWKVKVMPVKNGQYMIFPGGYIKPLDSADNIRNERVKTLIEDGNIRSDNMYINTFITCNNIEDAKLIIEGK